MTEPGRYDLCTCGHFFWCHHEGGLPGCDGYADGCPCKGFTPAAAPAASGIRAQVTQLVRLLTVAATPILPRSLSSRAVLALVRDAEARARRVLGRKRSA